MKKIVLTVMALILGFSFIACNTKKENKTQLRTGRGSHLNNGYGVGGYNGNPQSGPGQIQGSGWDILEQLPQSDITSNNLDANSKAFIRTFFPGELGYIQGATVRMQLGAPGNARLGMAFWDDLALSGNEHPVMVYMGPETGANVVYEVRNQTQVRARFTDSFGSVIIDARIYAGQLQGMILHGNGQQIGQFFLPAQAVMF